MTMGTGEVASGRSGGWWRFVTLVEEERPDGLVARWEARAQRKAGCSPAGGTWWDPGHRGWWIGVLFAVGASAFAVGAVPFYADAVGPTDDAVTFFVGSLFFTAAGFLQYRESVDAGRPAPPRGWRRVVAYRGDQLGWWATLVQLLGTLEFNVSTGAALRTDVADPAYRAHVWRPDALGSVCFLVASALAWWEVCHGWTAWRPRVLGWWITLLNLVGSVAFGVSAVAAAVVTDTATLRNAELSNLGTLVGAVCFLVGAVLLLPERTVASPAPPTRHVPGPGDGSAG
jgi:hypothetical protein